MVVGGGAVGSGGAALGGEGGGGSSGAGCGSSARAEWRGSAESESAAAKHFQKQEDNFIGLLAYALKLNFIELNSNLCVFI